ncbi:MAG: hypothetical protein J5517_04890 [Eubacterium sp.]|nr:hypothetical protein [Eubacterium sp.]
MKFGDKSKRIIARIIAAMMILSYSPSVFGVSGSVNAARVFDVSSPSDSDYNSVESTETYSGDGLDEYNPNNPFGDNGTITDINGNPIDLGNDLISTATDAVEEESYSVIPDTDTTTYTAYKNMEEWKVRKTFKAPENTYSLSVCTAATAGENVLYFSIRYMDREGITRTQFLFPHVDAYERSNKFLNYYSKEDITATYGKKMAAEMNYKETPGKAAVLGAWTIQDYAFQTEAPIYRVRSIDIYVEQGTYSCSGLAIYKVDEYKGYEEYGMISGQTFLDFKGYMIADTTKKTGAALSGGGMDFVTTIGGTHDSGKFVLNTYEDNCPEKNYAGEESLYSFRMDFADTVTGGIESFINSSATPITEDNGIVEDLSLMVQYKDIHGWNRKVTLPVILNSYGQARKTASSDTILGFAQRGDTIAFQAVLPECASIVDEVKIMAGTKARTEVKNTGGIEISKETSKMSRALSGTASEDISIQGFSVYKGGCMAYTLGGTDSDGNHLKGATLYYAFQDQYPLKYYTTTKEDGNQIRADGTDTLRLDPYEAEAPILGYTPGGDQFLVTVSTSDIENAGSSKDISMRFSYKDMEGANKYTPLYKIKQAADDYLGKWKTVNDGDFIEETGLVAGGKLSFIIDADNMRDFTGVEVNMGGDSWTLHNLTIAYLEKYDSRAAYNTTVTSAGATSNFWVERSAIAVKIFSLLGNPTKVTDEDGNTVDNNGEKQKEYRYKVDPETGEYELDENNNPILEEVPDDEKDTDDDVKINTDITLKPDTIYRIDFDTENDVDLRTTKYSEVRYTMTHDQTQINWGFFKKRKIYSVGVKVAKDSDHDTGDGDSGSTNHFYFQLIFKNGNSGYVLANQQITSDGFRSGYTEYFTIATNQNYGELKGLRIIPEDTSSDSDPFDKLNIEKITVSEQNSGGSYISYIIGDVGWIDIDYHDEIEGIAPRGQKARVANELSKVYRVTDKQKNVKLVCEISAEPWSGTFDPFYGSMKAEIAYISAVTHEEELVTIDVVQCMADYMGINVASIETATNPNVQIVKEDGLGTLSDSKWMFRPNHTDRMILPAIPDLESLVSIKFTGQNLGSHAAKWCIKNISVLQVIEDGAIQLTKSNELYRNIAYRKVCLGNINGVVEGTYDIGGKDYIGPITFTANKIIWNDTDDWATPVSRIPDSTDDKINIFVYPTYGSKNDTGASVNVNFRYDIPFSQYKVIAESDLKATKDLNGRDMYMVKGVSAPDFVGAQDFTVYCKSNMTFDKAIVQHVREDTVISNYYYNLIDGVATGGNSGFLSDNMEDIDYTEETIGIGFDAGTKEKILQPMKLDVAVAFEYRSSLDGGTYYSPYVYLTDQGYKKTSEGLYAELYYDVPFVNDITAYYIAGYGSIEANIAGAAAQVYKVDERELNVATCEMETKARSKRSYAAFNQTHELKDSPQKKKRTSETPYGKDSIAPVKLTFATSDSTATKDGSTKSAVRMKFHYIDYKKVEQKERVEYEDICPYIQSDSKQFLSGENQTVVVFLKNINDQLSLNTIDILPYNADVEIKQEDAQVAESVDDKSTEQTLADSVGDGEEADTSTKKAEKLADKIIDSRTAYWTITSVSADIGFGARVIDRNNINQTFDGLDNGDVLRLLDVTLRTSIQQNNKPAVTVKDNLLTLVGEKGDKIKGTVTIGKSKGFNVKASVMVGDAPKDVTKDTITRSDDYYFTFTVPKNTSGSLVVYKIEVSPVDAPDIIDTILVNVESREDIKLNTSVARNNESGVTVTGGSLQMFALPKDTINGTVLIVGSDKGFTAKAYKVSKNKDTDVTKDLLTLSDEYHFSLKIPEKVSDDTELYKIVVTCVEDPDLVDTVVITVNNEGTAEATPTPEPTPEPKNITLTTNIAKNTDSGSNVSGGLMSLSAETGDSISGYILIDGSDEGFKLKVTLASGTIDGNADNLMANWVEKYDDSFRFIIPKITSESAQFKIVVSSAEDSSIKDTIIVSAKPSENFDPQTTPIAPPDDGD